MKLMSLVAENFKKLKLVELDFDESGVVKISGRNKQGKSTVLESLWVALGGGTETPEHPIRNGEDRAEIKLTFDDIVVKRVITENSNRLIVTDVEGKKISSPQSLLNSLVTKIGLRPRAFVNADKNEQVEMLLEVIDLDFNTERLSKITDGILVKGNNPIETIDKTYDEIYDKRTDINVQKRNTKGSFELYSDVEKAESVSVSELMEEKENIEKEREELYDLEDELKTIKEEYEGLIEERNVIKDKIKELQKQLENKKEECNKVDKIYNKKKKEYKPKIEMIPGKDEKIKNINDQLKKADDINKKAQKWEEKQKAKEKLEKLKDQSNVYTNMLNMIKDYKDELLSWANFPIEGLSFKEGEVWYNDAPLSQASKTEKLEVGFAIMAALNPDLKVVLVDDGNTIDSENLEFLEKLAKEEGYIVLMEYMDEDAKTGIVIEDGEIVADYYSDPFEGQVGA
ncbi:MAG: AAA family ATPase [Halanaerobiales bacterium]